MNRRSFFRRVAIGGAIATVAPGVIAKACEPKMVSAGGIWETVQAVPYLIIWATGDNLTPKSEEQREALKKMYYDASSFTRIPFESKGPVIWGTGGEGFKPRKKK